MIDEKFSKKMRELVFEGMREKKIKPCQRVYFRQKKYDGFFFLKRGVFILATKNGLIVPYVIKCKNYCVDEWTYPYRYMSIEDTLYLLFSGNVKLRRLDKEKQYSFPWEV